MNTEFSDLEIQMEVFRAMRSGHYLSNSGAKNLIRDTQLQFPEVPAERIKQVITDMTRRLLANPS